MAKKSGSAADKARATAYKALDKRTLNAKIRLARHLKKHPEDEQAQAALAGAGSRKFRTKPNSKGGWVTEKLRNAMLYVPYLTAKGMPIGLRFPEQLGSFLNSHGQSVPLTRTNTKAYAQLVRYQGKAPFHLTPVTVVKKTKDGEEVSLELKHISKLSNFKG